LTLRPLLLATPAPAKAISTSRLVNSNSGSGRQKCQVFGHWDLSVLGDDVDRLSPPTIG
jgi:hypothetical protein